MRTIYLDHNATTPLDPRVQAAMVEVMDQVHANPSSIHRLGRVARATLDEARERIATALQCQPAELVFTSGGTEANNLALLGAARAQCDRGRHLITSAVEHHAVLGPLQYLAAHEGFSLTIVPVDGQGRVDPESVRAAFRTDTVLVSIMSANNEIGTLQPIPEIASLCRARNILFHTDAAQWFGKEPTQTLLEAGADLVSLCAHKFHGPTGAGLLYARRGTPLRGALFGGSQEYERRPGTENLPAIVGLARAIELFLHDPPFNTTCLKELAAQLAGGIDALPSCHRWASKAPRLTNTVAFSVAGCDSLGVLAALDLEGICASSGSACTAGSLQPSHVVTALGAGPDLAAALIRFSLGRDNSRADVVQVLEVLPGVLARVQGSR